MDVISAILEIDNTAKEMMKNAESKRDEILSEARETENSVREDIMEAADKQLAKYDEQEKQIFGQRQEQLRTDTEAAIKRLDTIFEQNHEKWEQQIFDSIIG